MTDQYDAAVAKVLGLSYRGDLGWFIRIDNEVQSKPYDEELAKDWNALMQAVAKLETNGDYDVFFSREEYSGDKGTWNLNGCDGWELEFQFTKGDLQSEALAVAKLIHACVESEK